MVQKKKKKTLRVKCVSILNLNNDVNGKHLDPFSFTVAKSGQDIKLYKTNDNNSLKVCYKDLLSRERERIFQSSYCIKFYLTSTGFRLRMIKFSALIIINL